MRRNFEQSFEVFDLETVPCEKAIKSDAWIYKKYKNEKLTDHDAGLNPIFGKIIALSHCEVIVYLKNGALNIHKSEPNTWYGLESDIISNFLHIVNNKSRFVAHNGLNFDFHFLAKRCIANKIQLPESLRLAGLKPWNISHVDTMQWAQMASNQYVSLDELCYLYGIPSSKDEMDGSQVWDFYKAGKIEDIARYCEKDVDRLTRIFIEMIKTGVHNLW